MTGVPNLQFIIYSFLNHSFIFTQTAVTEREIKFAVTNNTFLHFAIHSVTSYMAFIASHYILSTVYQGLIQ